MAGLKVHQSLQPLAWFNRTC